MLKVVSALIEKDGKYLIAKRSTGNKEVLGKYEFPGGKVELNESEEDAIIREIKEELDIDINVNKFLMNNVYEYPDRVIDLRLYECVMLNDNIKLHDHSDYKFVSKDELCNYEFCPPDIAFVDYIKNKA